MTTDLVTTKELFDLSSLNLGDTAQYAMVAKTGDTIAQYPFERIKFDQNRKVRFSILTTEVVFVKRHYTEDLGYFLCNGGACCDYAGKAASVSYLYPVVHYLDCTNSGKIISDAVQVKMVTCNKDMYNSLIGIQELKGDLTQFDLLGYQLPGQDRYPKTTLLEAGAAVWRNSQAILDQVRDYMQKNGDKFLSAAGKMLPDSAFDKANIATNIATTDADNGRGKLPVDTDITDIFRPQGL